MTDLNITIKAIWAATVIVNIAGAILQGNWHSLAGWIVALIAVFALIAKEMEA